MTNLLGTYLLACLVIVLAIVTWNWNNLCPACKPSKARVSPPLVTLVPAQSQLFTANAPVRWIGPDMSESIDGLFKAPPAGPAGVSRFVFLAKRDGAQQTSETAEVIVSSKGGLSLQPSRATITTGSSIDLAAVPISASAPPAEAPTFNWLSPAIGTLTPTSPNGPTARFSVPASAVDHPTTVLILARVADDPTRIAGAWITIRPASLLTGICEEGDDYNVGGLLLLLALMGALGAIIHGISSFTIFVGNREFTPSWIWWYIFKPFLGGLVALVVFLVFRAGFGAGSFFLDAADCLKSAAFAALIGLFAEPATLKLKDVFETLFTPRNDPRRDPAGGSKPTNPTLVSLDPFSVTVGQSAQLTLHGTGFATDCQVKIGSLPPRKPISVTANQLVISLKPEDLPKLGKLDVIVYNQPPDGAPSNLLKLEVIADNQHDSAGETKAAAPSLVSLDPPTVNVGQNVLLTLHGTGFAPECQVKIGSSDLGSRSLLSWRRP